MMTLFNRTITEIVDFFYNKDKRKISMYKLEALLSAAPMLMFAEIWVPGKQSSLLKIRIRLSNMGKKQA